MVQINRCCETLLEKRLFGSLLVLTAVGICLFFAIIMQYKTVSTLRKSVQETSSRKICASRACVQTSSTILKSMDISVNPCDDFYNFVCSGFINNSVLTNDLLWGSADKLEQVKIDLELNDLLMRPINENDPKHIKLMKQYYDSCMDKETISKNSIKELKEIFKELGGWPVLDGDNWNETFFDWKEYTYMAKKLGFSYTDIINLYAGFSEGDPLNFKILYISEHLIFTTLSKNAYYDYVVDEAVVFGADRENASKEMLEAYNFQLELEAILFKSKNEHSIEVPIKNLTFYWPDFDWMEYINKLLEPDMKVTQDYEITFKSVKPEYLTFLHELLARTSKRTIANKLMMQLVQSATPFMSEEVFLPFISLLQKLGLNNEFKDRWGECVVNVHDNWSVASTSMYLKAYMNNVHEKRANITELANYIKDNIKLTVLEKFGNHQKLLNILERVDGMKFLIGYPDQLSNDENVEEYYENLEFDAHISSYLHLGIKLSAFGSRRDFRAMRDRKFNWVEYLNSATSSNYEYEEPYKSVIVTVKDLRRSFKYFNDLPKFISIGEFVNKLQHIYKIAYDEEYENNTCSVLNENYYPKGFLLDMIFEVYNNKMKHEDEDISFMGFTNFTSNQMFFISYALSHCTKRRHRFEHTRISTEDEEHLEFLNTIKYSRHFYKEFDCPLNVTKCEKDVP